MKRDGKAICIDSKPIHTPVSSSRTRTSSSQDLNLKTKRWCQSIGAYENDYYDGLDSSSQCVLAGSKGRRGSTRA